MTLRLVLIVVSMNHNQFFYCVGNYFEWCRRRLTLIEMLHSVVQSSFPVIHRVGNIDIFVQLKSGNDYKLSKLFCKFVFVLVFWNTIDVTDTGTLFSDLRNTKMSTFSTLCITGKLEWNSKRVGAFLQNDKYKTYHIYEDNCLAA